MMAYLKRDNEPKNEIGGAYIRNASSRLPQAHGGDRMIPPYIGIHEEVDETIENSGTSKDLDSGGGRTQEPSRPLGSLMAYGGGRTVPLVGSGRPDDILDYSLYTVVDSYTSVNIDKTDVYACPSLYNV